MVAVAQLAERLTVDQVVAGSNPASHPILLCAPVAQLDRASDFGSDGCGFKSCRARHLPVIARDTKEVATMEVLKVASNSKPNAVAGALAGVIREKGIAELQAIGAGAVNQAVKAIAIARGYVAPSGINLICLPSFADVEIDGEVRTAIKFLVKPNE